MEKKSRPPLRYVVYFYAFATIQIILVHSRMMRVENPTWIAEMVDFIADYHMVLFFFIAGVLLSYTADKHESLWEWYKGKLIRLISPFLILTAVAFLPKVLLEPILHNGADISVTYILKVLFYPRKTIWGHFWFIPVYLVIMPLCFVLLKTLHRHKIAWGGVILVSALINYYPIDIGWFGISDICRFLFYSVLGMTVEPWVNKENVKKKLGDWVTLIPLLILAIISYYFSVSKLIMKIHILLMIMLLLSVSMMIEHLRLGWLETVGKNKMTIYVYSWPVQAIIEIALIQILNVNVNIVFIIKVIFGLTIPLLMKWIANKLNFIDGICRYLGL